ncbi:MAG: NusA N-terminal domain-containing protein, partial [Aristaeellaceae bacterium]
MTGYAYNISRKADRKNMAKSEVIEAIKLLAKEKEISEEMLFSTIEEALKAAYRKNLPKGVPVPNNL